MLRNVSLLRVPVQVISFPLMLLKKKYCNLIDSHLSRNRPLLHFITFPTHSHGLELLVSVS